ALLEIAGRLAAEKKDLAALPGAVTAALQVRFANYDLALTAVGALPIMLKEVASVWAKPRPGQPKLWIEAEVISLLIECQRRREDASADRSNNASRRAASWSTAFQFD
ncbi:MAG TPA: hypothetical protein VK621_22280, partial [Bradyrhizobium sp.]|nr:hypothetical protein [Bradyrhizobium sp.]